MTRVSHSKKKNFNYVLFIILATTLIEKMYFKKYFTKGAVLLAIRPLKIGSHNRAVDYWKFKPPKG